MKELIEFSEFLEIEKKLEIKVGKITTVEEVPKSTKLLKMMVDFGTETRQVVTNIKPKLVFECSELVGMQFVFITNLKPVNIMGIESTAMIMPGDMLDGQIINATGKVGSILL
jgi:methionine--tRNA ligase beta chain